MNPNQLDIPIQPVEQPILCSPYKEPDAHWVYDTETGEARRCGLKPALPEAARKFKSRSDAIRKWNTKTRRSSSA